MSTISMTDVPPLVAELTPESVKEASPPPMMPIDQITILAHRGRKDFGDLMALATSIKAVGVISPVALKPDPENPNKFVLLAGERRYRASIIAGKKTIPYRFYNELPQHEQKQIELAENLDRKSLSWVEESLIRAQIHEANVAAGIQANPNDPTSPIRPATQADTAIALGVGQSDLSKALKIAKYKKENPELLARFANLPMAAAIKAIEQSKDIEHARKQIASGARTLNATIRLGDAIALMSELNEGSVQYVSADLPFGIREIEDSGGETRGDSQVYQGLLKPNDNLSLDDAKRFIDNLAGPLFRCMSEGAYFHLFHSADIWEHLVSSLRGAGFIVAPKPVIWDKEVITSGFTGYNHPSSYEPILFGFKPPNKWRLVNPIRDVVRFAKVTSKNRTHIFEKPVPLLRKLLENCTKPGDVCLDFCCGSGAFLEACIDSSREGIGMEIDNEHFMVAQERVRKLLISRGSTVNPVPQ